MINLIVFSKDRASQLHLLMESVALQSYKLFDGITVIYTSSSPEFAAGYDKLCKQKIIPRIKVEWKQEQLLVEDTLGVLRQYQGNNNLIGFLTDDSVFYRPVHDYKFVIETLLHSASDIACFTLRMGKNTKQQMYWDKHYQADLKYTEVNDIIKWRHMDYPLSHNYGYPTSLDGHIFRAAQLLDLVQDLGGFANVNSLEGSLCKYKPELKPCMAAFAQSVLVTVPINRVQSVASNNAGLYYGISPEELNNRYLLGQVIDYASIDFSNITGTHQELEYKFRRA